jgi:hypothetical protein
MHGGLAEQLRNSLKKPVTGAPLGELGVAMSRVRFWYAPPQDLLQGDHTPHADQAACNTVVWHAAVLQ